MEYEKKYDVEEKAQDWTIGTILDKLKKINLDVPYQRKIVWNEKQREYFIDSIINGFSIFPVTLNVVSPKYNNDYGNNYEWNCIDGKQRLTSIKMFAEGEFKINIKLKGKDEEKFVTYNEIKSQFDMEVPFKVRIYKGLDKTGESGIFDRLQNGLSCTLGERINAIDSKLITFIQNEIVPKYSHVLSLISTSNASKRRGDIKTYVELYAACIDNRLEKWSLDEYKEYINTKTDEIEFIKFKKALDQVKIKIKINPLTLKMILIRGVLGFETEEMLVKIINNRLNDLKMKTVSKAKLETYKEIFIEADKFSNIGSKEKKKIIYDALMNDGVKKYKKLLDN